MNAAQLEMHRVPPEEFWQLGYLGDGYDRIGLADRNGWHALPSWGQDGWDLGDWPFVVIFVRDTKAKDIARGLQVGHGHYGLVQNVEGDASCYRFGSAEARAAALDYLFAWYQVDGDLKEEFASLGITRDALDAGTIRLPEIYHGPYRERVTS